MNKMLNAVVTALSVVALCISTFCLTKVMQSPDPVKKDIQYVLYLGTNDKDTNEPVLPSKEAKEQLKKILIQRFG